MKVTIETGPNEKATLVLETQERQFGENQKSDIATRITGFANQSIRDNPLTNQQ